MKKGQTEFQVVTFRTGMETYGMDIDQIREIIMTQDITPVPGMKDTVKGIINLRGEIIPVIELAEILKVREKLEETNKRKPRVIILDRDQGGYGVLVDEVMEVVKVSPEDVNTQIGQEQIVMSDYMVKGIIHTSGKMIIYLDPVEILAGAPSMEEGDDTTEHLAVPI
jgi:chemotaxis signal transduction protein